MTMSRRGMLTLSAAAMAMASVGQASAAEARPFEAQALSWVRANAHALPADPAIADFRRMVDLLSEARIVGVGEATHGTHEDFFAKCQLIKALVTFGGVRTVALEANLSAGRELDAYVSQGAGDIAAVMRDSGLFQNWQSEEFGGLFMWLRAWNLAGKDPVRVVAIDCQASPADAGYAFGWLEGTGSVEVEPLRPKLAGLTTPENRNSRLLEVVQAITAAERDAYIAALVELKAAIDRQAGKPGHDLAAHAAEVARQGLLVFERDVKDGPREEPPLDYWSRRDRFMADNLISLAGPGRTVLHAHNVHVLPIPFGDGPEPEGSQGLYLRRKLGRAYQTVAFEYDHGAIHAKLMKKGQDVPGRDAPWVVSTRPSRPEGLGGFLAKTGMERFWLDLRSSPPSPALQAWRKHPYQHDWPGFVVSEDLAVNDEERLPIEGIIDLLVFFRSVTPSRFYDYVKQA